MRRMDRFAGRLSVLIVLAVALVATVLLVRTERNAASIHDKTSNIATSSRVINGSTDALGGLERTNELAGKIAEALQPLARPVGRIDDRSARIAELLVGIRTSTASIDVSSKSIDESAQTIRGGLVTIDANTGAINSRLGDLNADAARILGVMTRIQRGVNLIDTDLTATARVLEGILAEARNILTALGSTERLAGCIDRGLNGGSGCPGRAGP